jgi:dTDP-4-amino-4,6-dideoxygalactose transaminase
MERIDKRKDFLPFSFPSIGKEEKIEVLKVMDSGWLTTGPKTQEFENNFAKYVGSKEALAVTSCTAAIHLCLALLDIKKNDEIILPSFTFPSTANEIIHLGGKPVLVDIEPDTFNIDIQQIEKKINKRTRAIIPTHYGGHPCDMDRILAIGRKYHIPVIEDAAHAHGSLYKKKKIGSLNSFATCFSFYPTKNMTTGEGGMITTQNSDVAKKLRIYSLHGIKKDAWKRYSKTGSWYFEIILSGYKYNLSDIQSAIGVAQLRKLDAFTKSRTRLAKQYTKLLSGVADIQLPKVNPYATHNWHLFPILGKHWTFKQRNRIIEQLRDWNIGTSVHFIPIHHHPYYHKAYNYKQSDFPVTEKVFSQLISLPIYPGMTLDDVDYVTQAVKESMNKI